MPIGAYASKESGPGSFAIYSDDHGKTWDRSSSTGDTSTEECQIAPMGKQLVMITRTPLGHFMAYSNDTGETWFGMNMPSSLNPQTDCEGSILSIPYEGVYMNTHLYTTQPKYHVLPFSGRRQDMESRLSSLERTFCIFQPGL